ncbi:MAG: hypothetical protein IJC18_02355 [Clostridia bacterium]|nr:hypothetical protein [Clostridia bacterium]
MKVDVLLCKGEKRSRKYGRVRGGAGEPIIVKLPVKIREPREKVSEAIGEVEKVGALLQEVDVTAAEDAVENAEDAICENCSDDEVVEPEYDDEEAELLAMIEAEEAEMRAQMEEQA